MRTDRSVGGSGETWGLVGRREGMHRGGGGGGVGLP